MSARLMRRLVISAAALWVGACSDAQKSPTTPTTTVTPSAPQVRELSIIGTPTNLRIGATAQLRAAARADDGGFQDVTERAAWESSDSNVCAVKGSGVVEGLGAGSATLTARYAGIAGTVSLTCGFAITAVVHENEPTTNVVLADARVEVVGGPLDGQSFATDANGRVTLPPVAAAGFALYVKKRGYDDRRLEVFEFPRQTTLDVSLYPEPVTQYEFSGPCGASPGYRIIPITVPRQGRLRIFVSTSGFPPFRWILANVSDPGRLLLEASTYRGSSAEAEALIDAGSYRFYYQGTDCGTAAASWRVRLEYPR